MEPVSDVGPWRRARTGCVAHRGGAHEAPENTLYAFIKGLGAGADAIELDIQGTHDGVPIVTHDTDLVRCAGVDRRVDTMTLDEVQSVDPCAEHPRLAGIATGAVDPPAGHSAMHFRIPTLDEVLSELPGVPIIVELKETAPLEAVADVLVRHGRGRDALVVSFDDDKSRAVRELAPEVALAPGVQGVMAFMDRDDGAWDAVNVPHQLSGRPFVTERFVQRAHDRGVAVIVWTVNEADVAKRLISYGVDMLVTDVPRTLQAWMPKVARDAVIAGATEEE